MDRSVWQPRHSTQVSIPRNYNWHTKFSCDSLKTPYYIWQSLSFRSDGSLIMIYRKNTKTISYLENPPISSPIGLHPMQRTHNQNGVRNLREGSPSITHTTSLTLLPQCAVHAMGHNIKSVRPCSDNSIANRLQLSLSKSSKTSIVSAS